MKVSLHELQSIRIARLEVVDPEASGVHVGEQIGYYCLGCQQADETLDQIWHDESCALAGEHGRSHYDDLEPDVPGRPVPELDPEHEITLVHAAETDSPHGVHHGAVLAFRCACGNLDEDLFEVVHDERCSLAGRHLDTTQHAHGDHAQGVDG